MSTGDVRVTLQRGFTYMGVLLGVALIGVGLSMTATVWSKEAERQRKAEAEWVLTQYERALRSYYNAAPGSVKVLPATVEELLLDQRQLGLLRHLRKEYTVNCNHRYTTNITYQPKSISATLLISCPLDGVPLARREVVLATISN
jgi:type II secretory pathway pseudopilin PulG